MRIGLVLSGGDVSGMNNFLFQINRMTESDMVIYDGGINGLIENRCKDIARRDLIDLSLSSVPLVASGRKEDKCRKSDYEKIAKNIRHKKLDCLIMGGGDGSFQFLKTLSRYGICCYGVGMTIDNDIDGDSYTIGFSTACEQVISEVAKLRNTGRGLPGRIFIIELLGGYCGELTLQAALKSNADIALIPESLWDINVLAETIKQKIKIQNSVIILCSEGYTKEYTPGFQGAIDTMIGKIEHKVGIRIRKTILGYGLRNGTPTGEEIIQGAILAEEVVRCIHSGLTNKIVVINNNNKAIPIDLENIKKRLVDEDSYLYKLAKINHLI
ncbi:permease [Lonsdalea britannica]|uniref:6-phosphofructokinase n=1 Tax=Lonsdalea britannica TaxID=1082704 RepID=A0AAD0WL49_9GAMM|nr:6-phosphofructokinase [Lonsdalea britannica]AXW87078.1 permease [Lonsdalea britannica]OSM99241.1 permease [Lonsdalea britannica]OSN03021.1 permease [Lonsdalea britannica]